ncbi:MAG: CRISPR-associated helicase/endonuclease Cas3 [Deltaproteobacteria bacterium HGW-Deltaproteobacteria-18]|nr:MAG: CRISPR-associated helicase/endonuclease Cas3 [Deltaproteobacteria bacterium HGW-Deltaproteobacteria-18]
MTPAVSNDIYFWAKTTAEGQLGISVTEHMLNVGHVARLLADLSPQLCQRLNLSPEIVAALAALHDLGKISPGFQQKCPAWLERFAMSAIAEHNSWQTSVETDHGRVSHASIQQALMELGVSRKTAKYISAILGAHHGRIKALPSDRGISCVMSESASGIAWNELRFHTVRKVWSHFGAMMDFSALTVSESGLWWLGGLTSVADWIGSDERFFPPDKEMSEFKGMSAQAALEHIGFHHPRITADLSFECIFPFSPNELQERAAAIITTPGVYIIEAPMGMGKTEAALWAAYHLLCSGYASGVYFALPTQATSNRIHLRMNEFLDRITDNASASRLVHGNSWLLEGSDVPKTPATTVHGAAEDDARASQDWFASTKRALLAPFGVGTVDQCLLGVVAAKHFFVRHFALAGKVVILDEIHSYDLYTGTLIDKLIKTLEGLGCTVIILSATLTAKRRDQLLVTVFITPPQGRQIRTCFSTADDAMSRAKDMAQRGGAVLWICNTVDSAQHIFRELSERCGEAFPIGLLHSRFTFPRREALEQEWMERFGKNGSRCGSILVATQVVEQSVDLDADLLVTELAPTDMLLQRIGRLWRHQRSGRPAYEPVVMIVEEASSLEAFRTMKPAAIIKELGAKAKVYAPYVLLRSLEVWKTHEQVEIPRQIRALLEATYAESENEPESWSALYGEWFASDSAKKMIAQQNANYWTVALPDEEGVQTRLNEMPTISLILCSEHSSSQSVLLSGEVILARGQDFSLAAARAIHRNLVKVPEYLISYGQEPGETLFNMYVRGRFIVGVVDAAGSVSIKGLQSGNRLFYMDSLGLVIDRSS